MTYSFTEFFTIVYNGFLFYLNEYLYEYGYKIVLQYSKCEIYLKPYLKPCEDVYDTYISPFFSFGRKKNSMEIVKNGETIFTSDEKEYLKYESLEGDYDFIVYSDVSKHGKTNNVIYKTIPTDGYHYKTSNVSFFLVDFEYLENNSVPQEIHFKTDEYNYYIVGNEINEAFMKYFLQKHYPDLYKGENTRYTLTIIDNNVSKVIIDNKQSIQFLENSYNLDVK